jgi:hypothetical protein
MKRTHNIVSIAVSVCLLAAVSGCTANFDDINKNPYAAYKDDLSETAKVAVNFPPMISTIFHSQQNKCQHTEQMVGLYGGHIVCSANWRGSNFANFNPLREWNDSPWNDGFSLFYVSYMEVKEATNSEGYLYHWANIMRVASQHRVADMYGPIPYSKVGSGSLTPEYDSVEEIYKTMINELTTSIDSLTDLINATGTTSSIPAGEYDPVYTATTGELLKKWVKYANSLKLRLAVRIALVDPTDFAVNAIREAIEDPIGPIIDNADNAENSAIPDNVTAGYYAATLWGDMMVNATLTTYLNAWKDPRRAKYMRSGTLSGIVQGLEGIGLSHLEGKSVDFTGYVGMRMGAVIGTNNERYDYDRIPPDTDPLTYTIMSVTDPWPVLLFCAAETHFLKAEAALRGWYGSPGEAQSHYETGILTSMDQYKVPIGDYMSQKMTAENCKYSDPGQYPDEEDYSFDLFASFSDLKGNPSATLDVAWPTAGTDEQKLEAIMTQKWIAMYRLGIESWSDWRRTGYPRIFPGVNDKSASDDFAIDKVKNPLTGINISDKRMARRLRYPYIERSSNPVNYQKAVEMLGGIDDLSTDLWWAKSRQ